uniref:Uncharacterized protein n=1 Tax=Oryza nivara TaxID=4536 RepID=A0A0E0IGT4_ORYNI
MADAIHSWLWRQDALEAAKRHDAIATLWRRLNNNVSSWPDNNGKAYGRLYYCDQPSIKLFCEHMVEQTNPRSVAPLNVHKGQHNRWP